MLLFGCLIAVVIAFAPRVVLILAWIFSERWEVVWGGTFIWPLLDIMKWAQIANNRRGIPGYPETAY